MLVAVKQWLLKQKENETSFYHMSSDRAVRAVIVCLCQSQIWCSTEMVKRSISLATSHNSFEILIFDAKCLHEISTGSRGPMGH